MSKERALLKKVLATGWLDHTLSCEVEAILAQPEQKQEPVAWHYIYDDGITVRERVTECMPLGEHYTITPLYTSPPKREQEWQGLTEDEIVEILDTTHFNEDKFCFLEACINYCCAIQAKLKRKNTLTEIKKPLAQPEQEAVEDRIARWHKLGYEQGKKASKREPLSEDQVSELLMSGFSTHLMDLVRIIEKAHGIGECNSHYKERHETFGEEV